MDSATCIVALADQGKVWIGGDSLAYSSLSGDKASLTNRKVFARKDLAGNKWLFGFTGSYRLGQVLQHVLQLPALDQTLDLLEDMVTRFVPALQRCFKESALESKESGQFTGGAFLVSVRGRIFNVEKQYSIQESTLPFAAIGCGAPFALGSLFSSEGLNPEERITLALSAAETFSAGVQRPFHILNYDCK